MSVPKTKGPVIDPGVCRCCGISKKCRVLNVEYEWLGQKEIYSDMLFDCFGLLLSNLDGPTEDCLICATCVSRIREACSFRKQVLLCEELLLARMHSFNDDSPNIKSEVIKKDVADKHLLDGKPDIAHEHLLDEKQDMVCDDDMDCENADISITDEGIDVKGETVKYKISKTKRNSSKMLKKHKSSKILSKGYKSKKLLKKFDIIDEDDLPLKSVLPKAKIHDNNLKSLQNTITIVENSFVCPFDTSFSDYFCIYCREVYTDPEKLREHTLIHDPYTFKDVAINKKMLLVDILRIDCRLCPTKINDVDYLKQHLKESHGKTFYSINNEFLKFKLTMTCLTCLECGNTYSFFHALKKHMAVHFGACICDVCGAHYFEERMLLLHQKFHQKVDENYPCNECGKNFKSKQSRYLHEAKVHKNEPIYPCSKCDEIFFSHSLRRKHIIDVHNGRRLYPCEHCDRTYDSRKSLREHNRRFHLKIFKHQCELCDKRFYLPSRLKEHLVTHTGERNFRCEFCGKSYPRLRGLKVHMQSHISEKKFRCVFCNAAFTQNFNLKNHVKRQHQNLEINNYPE